MRSCGREIKISHWKKGGCTLIFMSNDVERCFIIKFRVELSFSCQPRGGWITLPDASTPAWSPDSGPREEDFLSPTTVTAAASFSCGASPVRLTWNILLGIHQEGKSAVICWLHWGGNLADWVILQPPHFYSSVDLLCDFFFFTLHHRWYKKDVRSCGTSENKDEHQCGLGQMFGKWCWRVGHWGQPVWLQFPFLPLDAAK